MDQNWRTSEAILQGSAEGFIHGMSVLGGEAAANASLASFTLHCRLRMEPDGHSVKIGNLGGNGTNNEMEMRQNGSCCRFEKVDRLN